MIRRQTNFSGRLGTQMDLAKTFLLQMPIRLFAIHQSGMTTKPINLRTQAVKLSESQNNNTKTVSQKTVRRNKAQTSLAGSFRQKDRETCKGKLLATNMIVPVQDRVLERGAGVGKGTMIESEKLVITEGVLTTGTVGRMSIGDEWTTEGIIPISTMIVPDTMITTIATTVISMIVIAIVISIIISIMIVGIDGIGAMKTMKGKTSSEYSTDALTTRKWKTSNDALRS